MSSEALEQLLRDLPQHGTLVKDRGYRQVWRFEFQGKGYYLKFYPRLGSNSLKRLTRGSPARREFMRLQSLQRAKVPAPRAVAQLVGLKINHVLGDAVILEEIASATPLDEYVSKFGRVGENIPDHRLIARKIIELLEQLGRAGLGHGDLHLGNLLLRDGEVYLLDGYAVSLRGLTLKSVMKLAHSVQGVATRTDLQRGWNELGPGGPMPTFNPVSGQLWKKFVEKTRRENSYFGKLKAGSWNGVFFKRYKYPRRWAAASAMCVSLADWQRAWPLLLEKIESDQLDVIKRGRSGDVLGGEVILGGKPVAVIVKRPFKRYWYRYLNEVGRGSRAWRAWHKAWTLIVRDLPTAWPLLVLQKRSAGYVTDAVIVCEKVPGPTLAQVDLDAMSANHREMLFRRVGRILRKIDQLRLSHFDAKASNWIVREDEKLGPYPVLIDVDGIRFRRWAALGITRLLRSMREHPRYTPADSLALCKGYAPYSSSVIRQEVPEDSAGK